VEHGTRASYQAGCACTRCRASNAAYIAGLRRQYRQHRTPLGHTVTAAEAAQHVKALLRERWSERDLAARAGLHPHTLRLTPESRVRLKTVLKVRRAYRLLMTDGPGDVTTEGKR
jgi:isochorismate hydrolase